MHTMNRQKYVELVEDNYFGSVAQAKLDVVLDCFTDDCLVTIRHGDNPLRLFRKHPAGAEKPLAGFYQHLCGNFDAWFGDFDHYIDPDSGKCACTFVVKLSPRKDSDYYPAGVQTLNNCNFFHYIDGKISEMTIYYSNTEAGSANNQSVSGPTGYPKE